MIVTPEGLNVFPEDVERVLQHVAGVRDSAVVGVADRRRRAGARRARARSRRRSGRGRPGGERRARRSPEDPARGGLARARAAAHRRHAKTEAGGDPRLAANAAPRRARPAGDGDKLSALVAKYAGRADLVADDHARGAGPELARTRGADGRARGCVSDAPRRRRVRRRARRGAAAHAGRAARPPAPRCRPIRWTSRPGTDRSRRGRSAASTCRSGSCRSPACSPGCASRGSSISRRSAGR